MKRFLVVMGMAAGLSVSALAQFTDNFSTSAVTSANWGTPATTAVGPIVGSTSGITFGQNDTDGRYNWMATIDTNGSGTNRMASLKTYVGSYSSDWTVSIGATNTFAPATGQSVQVGLFISNTTGMAIGGTHDYLKLVANQAANQNIHGGLHVNGSPVLGVTVVSGSNPASPTTGLSSTTGTLQVSYLASTHVLTAAYDFGSPQTFGTYGIAGSGGGTADANWGMSGSDTFTNSLYGQATGGAGYTLGNSTASLDDFSSSGLVAVPEPSTYAALLGAGVLSLALCVGGGRRRIGRERTFRPTSTNGQKVGRPLRGRPMLGSILRAKAAHGGPGPPGAIIVNGGPCTPGAAVFQLRVPVLRPRIRRVRVPAHLPEPELVLGEEGEAIDEFRALPGVELGNDHAG